MLEGLEVIKAASKSTLAESRQFEAGVSRV